MAYCIGMTKTEEINQKLEREVATLHQTIGGLMVRIESLEKQKSCLISTATEERKKRTALYDSLFDKIKESGLAG